MNMTDEQRRNVHRLQVAAYPEKLDDFLRPFFVGDVVISAREGTTTRTRITLKHRVPHNEDGARQVYGTAEKLMRLGWRRVGELIPQLDGVLMTYELVTT